MNAQKSYRLVKYIFAIWVLFLLLSWLVMFLWNWLMPDILSLRKISYLEAGGLLLLTKVLFGGFNKEHFKRKMFSEEDKDVHFVSAKKEFNLTSEQKAALKDTFYAKWCKKKNDEVEI